jgi:hypothetical protein
VEAAGCLSLECMLLYPMCAAVAMSVCFEKNKKNKKKTFLEDGLVCRVFCRFPCVCVSWSYPVDPV